MLVFQREYEFTPERIVTPDGLKTLTNWTCSFQVDEDYSLKWTYTRTFDIGRPFTTK